MRQDPQGKDVFKKIDLAPYDGPLPGSLPEGFQSKMQDLVYSMLRAAEKVNMAAEERCTSPCLQKRKQRAGNNYVIGNNPLRNRLRNRNNSTT